MFGRQKAWVMVAAVLALATFLAPMAIAAAENAIGEEGIGATTGKMASNEVIAIVVSTAFVVGMACIAAGYAVARVGAAALGAASERPEMLGRSLILVGLAEGIAIYGLIIGIMLLGLMK